MRNSFKIFIAVTAFGIASSIIACKRETPVAAVLNSPVLPETPYAYQTREPIPDHMSALVFSNTHLDDNIATLGRVLFYDPRLSANSTVSCGSCHNANYAFAIPKQFATGLIAVKTPRNAPSIQNITFYNSFFWDMRASRGLEDMSLMPVQNHIEMGISDLNAVVARVKQTPYYGPLFEKAFGRAELITELNIRTALAQFMRSVMSFRTKYDEGYATNFSNFNSQELAGKQLFENKFACVTCHVPPEFSSNGQGACTGLDEENVGDQGAGAFMQMQDSTGFNSLNGVFKIPTLRNIAYTAPYMHDGRFATLDQVLEHYSTGIKTVRNLDPRLQPGFTMIWGPTVNFSSDSPFNGPASNTVTPVRMNMTAIEKAQLIAFLNTLSDPKMISDVKYSNPFQH